MQGPGMVHHPCMRKCAVEGLHYGAAWRHGTAQRLPVHISRADRARHRKPGIQIHYVSDQISMSLTTGAPLEVEHGTANYILFPLMRHAPPRRNSHSGRHTEHEDVLLAPGYPQEGQIGQLDMRSQWAAAGCRAAQRL